MERTEGPGGLGSCRPRMEDANEQEVNEGVEPAEKKKRGQIKGRLLILLSACLS